LATFARRGRPVIAATLLERRLAEEFASFSLYSRRTIPMKVYGLDNAGPHAAQKAAPRRACSRMRPSPGRWPQHI